MSDHISAFIRKHRAAFDAALPGAHGFERVERALDRLKTADGIERELVYNRLLLDTADVPARLWFVIEAELDRRLAVGSHPPDGLEAFIAGNRAAFDVAEPSARLWAGIEQGMASGGAGMPPEQPLTARRGGKAAFRTALTWRRSFGRIAAGLALLLSGMGVGWWYGYSTAEDAMTMSQVSTEYAHLEQYYQQEIADREARLVNVSGGQPADVSADLEQIDRAMQELQHELAGVPPGNREQVVKAMIDNYKVKAAILQRVLEHLEPSNSNADPTHREPNYEVDSI